MAVNVPTILQLLLHLLFAAVLPPLLLGIINRTKAIVAGRRGQPLLQGYYDILKLLRKGSVFSRTTSWVFIAGPVVSLATCILCVLLLPLGQARAPLAFAGDMILFLYLLGLGRFFTTLAALDTGSAFEGMGAAREATFACLTEPALLFGLLVLCRLSGSMSLSQMLAWQHAWDAPGAAAGLVLASWFVVLLAESCRVPFDDPNTHLELTMIHEVMVLDHSGPALGVVLYSAALKLLLFEVLVLRAIVPLDLDHAWLSWPELLVGLCALSVVVGIVESVMARLRFLNVPRLLVTACVLSAFGIALLSR